MNTVQLANQIGTFKLTDEMKKSRLQSLFFSSLAILLVYAHPDKDIKFIGLDVEISSKKALAALIALAFFHLVGFFVEKERYLRSSKEPHKEFALSEFNKFVDELKSTIEGVVKIPHSSIQQVKAAFVNVVAAASINEHNTLKAIDSEISSYQYPRGGRESYDDMLPLEQQFESLKRIRADEERSFSLVLDKINAHLSNHKIDEVNNAVTVALSVIDSSPKEYDRIFEEVSRLEKSALDARDGVLDSLRGFEAFSRNAFKWWECAPVYVTFLAALTSSLSYVIIMSEKGSAALIPFCAIFSLLLFYLLSLLEEPLKAKRRLAAAWIMHVREKIFS